MGRVVFYAESAIPVLQSFKGLDSLAARALADNLERAVGILRKVIDRR